MSQATVLAQGLPKPSVFWEDSLLSKTDPQRLAGFFGPNFFSNDL